MALRLALHFGGVAGMLASGLDLVFSLWPAIPATTDIGVGFVGMAVAILVRPL